LFTRECEIELDDLWLINPDWVDYVEHLNKLAEDRPAYWEDDGAR
jgi:hypothetical protein